VAGEVSRAPVAPRSTHPAGGRVGHEPARGQEHRGARALPRSPPARRSRSNQGCVPLVARALERIAENEGRRPAGPQVGRRGVGMPTGASCRPCVRIGHDSRCTGVRVHLAQPASVRPPDLRRIRSRRHSQKSVRALPPVAEPESLTPHPRPVSHQHSPPPGRIGDCAIDQGAAKIMAADLDGTPMAGLVVHASRRQQVRGPYPARGLLAGGRERQQRAEMPEFGA
jgi:hypothetical protein